MPGFGEALIGLLAQRRKEQMLAQHRQDQLAQQQTDNDYRNRALGLQEDLRRDALDETARMHSITEARNKQDYALKLGDAIPGGQYLGAQDDAVRPLQSVGMVRQTPEIKAMGQDFQGPSPDATVQEMQQGRPGGFIKTASYKQQQDEAEARAKEEQARAQMERLMADSTERGRHNRAMENKPTAGERPYYTAVPEYDPTGRPIGGFSFNSRTGQLSPLNLPNGSTIKPPPGDLGKSAVQNEVSTDQLDRLKQMFDTGASSQVGPAQGRINTFIQGMPGMPADPKFAEFSAATAAFRNQVIKAITGAQMSEVEANRIRQQIPEVTDKPEVWAAKYAQTRQNLQDLQNRLRNPRPAGAAPAAPTLSADDLIKKALGR